MKGQISEFELGVLRARMHDARSSKAARGELRIGVPVGYIWDRDIGLSLDPDLRVQEAVRQIFARFRALGSARQALLALTAEQLCFPRPLDVELGIAYGQHRIAQVDIVERQALCFAEPKTGAVQKQVQSPKGARIELDRALPADVDGAEQALQLVTGEFPFE